MFVCRLILFGITSIFLALTSYVGENVRYPKDLREVISSERLSNLSIPISITSLPQYTTLDEPRGCRVSFKTKIALFKALANGGSHRINHGGSKIIEYDRITVPSFHSWHDCSEAALVAGGTAFYSVGTRECYSVKWINVTTVNFGIEPSPSSDDVYGLAGPHIDCARNATNDWIDGTCDSWCIDGVKHRTRTPTDTRYITETEKSWHLWEITACTEKPSCVQDDIKRRQKACPSVTPSKTNTNVSSWRECAKSCYDAAKIILGGIPSSLNVYQWFDAPCFRYTYDNKNKSCHHYKLANCPMDKDLADANSLTGDITLNVWSDDGIERYTTVEWSEWSPWTGCELVTSNTGWSARRRVEAVVGFNGDEALWQSRREVVPCRNNQGPIIYMSDFGDCCVWSEWSVSGSISECPSINCGTTGLITLTRNLQQQPIFLSQSQNSLSPGCTIDCLKQATGKALPCGLVKDCDDGCNYTPWGEWSNCTCDASSTPWKTRTRKSMSTEEDCANVFVRKPCDDFVCQGFSKVMWAAVAGGSVAVFFLLCIMIYAIRSNVSNSKKKERDKDDPIDDKKNLVEPNKSSSENDDYDDDDDDADDDGASAAQNDPS